MHPPDMKIVVAEMAMVYNYRDELYTKIELDKITQRVQGSKTNSRFNPRTRFLPFYNPEIGQLL